MSGLREQKSQVAVEIEAVEGTAETLVAADVILAYNPDFSPGVAMNTRNPVRSSLSPWAMVPGKRDAKLSFSSDLVGPGAAGDAIHLSDVLKICGVAEALVASTSATYTPASSSISSGSAAKYTDGKCLKLWGARGNARLVLDAGKPGLFTFDLQGADWSDTDAALLAGASLESTLPPIFQNATLTIDSYSAVLSKVEIDFGNTLTLRSSVNAASGNLSALITDRQPKITFDPENVLAATKDFMSIWRAGTEVAFSATIGSATGNTIEITAPKVQFESIKPASRDGLSVFEISAQLNGDSGDDEWQIQIT